MKQRVKNKHVIKIVSIILLCTIAVFIQSHKVQASTLNVNGSTSTSDIKTAIDSAISSGESEVVINFDSGLTEYNLSAPIRVRNVPTTPIEIIFRSSGGLTLNNAAGERHISVYVKDVTVTFDKVALNGKNNSGGIRINNASNVSIKNANITNCTNGYGGAIKVLGSSAVLDNCTVNNSTASDGDGGAVYASGSNLTINKGNYKDNKAARFGGGVFVTEKTLSISGAVISGNETESSADWQGGAGVATIKVKNVDIAKSEIKSNTAKNKGLGGGIYIHQETDAVSISETEFDGNKAASGGAIDINGGIAQFGHDIIGDVQITSCTINNNKALTTISGGGGIYAQNVKNMDIKLTKIDGNDSVQMGGGVMFLGNKAVKLDGVTLSNNKTTVYGGGAYVQDTTSVDIKGSEVKNNKSEGNGGGVYLVKVAGQIDSSKLTDNKTDKNGGGVYVATGNDYASSSNKTTLSTQGKSTFSLNHAALDGGGIFTENYKDYTKLTMNDYQNLNISKQTVFTGNTARASYKPVDFVKKYANIGYAQTSISESGGYRHPINNFDINYEATNAGPGGGGNGGTGGNGGNGGQGGSSKTGDNSNLALWIGLLFVSAGTLTGVIYRKRKDLIK